MAVEFIRVGAHEHVRIRNIGTYGVAIAGEHVGPGDVVDCPASEWHFLKGRGTFELVPPEAKAPVLPDPAVAPEPVIPPEEVKEAEPKSGKKKEGAKK